MKTIISNEIIVEDPTPELISWCRTNLIYNNPEYTTKLRMGLWLGNTPAKLYMYKISGNKMILPFGVLKRVWHLLKNHEYVVDFKVQKIYPVSRINLYDYQETAVRQMYEARNGVLVSKAGSGKGHPLNTILYTPNGTVKLGDLKVGDKLIGSDGKSITLTNIFDRGVLDTYRVTFTDNTYIDCDGDHLFNVQTKNDRYLGKNRWLTLSVNELKEKINKNNRKYFIPIVEPVKFNHKNVDLDPWLLGALIGDGGLSQPQLRISNSEKDIIDKVKEKLPKTDTLKHLYNYDYAILKKESGKEKTETLKAIIKYDLFGKRSYEKHIPEDYKYNDINTRLEVLRGIIDTDGSVSSLKGSVDITTTSKRLAFDIIELVQSLGGIAKMSTRHTKYTYKGQSKEGRESYRVYIKLYKFYPFSSEKHSKNYIVRKKYLRPYRIIKSIEYIGKKQIRCISVDARDKLYVAKDFIVTHNTQMMLELICRLGYKALWINNKKDLLNQALERAKANIVNCTFGTITEGKVNIGDITFSTIQTLSKIDLEAIKNEFGIIICDECFPIDTPILTKNGCKKIQKIQIGDKVLSYNHKNNIIEEKEVTNLFKKLPDEIITINNEITCTSNHPIYTKRGYIPAKELKENDYVLLYMWQRGKKGKYNKKSILSLFKKAKGLLFQRMCENDEEQICQEERIFGGDITKAFLYDERKMERRKFPKTKYRKNENEKSNSKYRSKKENKSKEERLQTNYTRWKWKRNDSSTKKDNRSLTTIKSCSRICSKNKLQKRRWLSYALQNRYSYYSEKNSHRNRWKFTQQSNNKKKRFKKRNFFKWIRVESIKIQKQTSDGKFGGLCRDGYVYNIEVKDNNNYFANNILVHNCQNFSGTPTKLTQTYKVLSKLSARYKYGCTACVHRSDGLMQAGLDLVGDVVYEVPESAIADKIVRAVVQPVHTQFVPELCIGADGTVEDFAKLVNEICFDSERNHLILEDLRQNKDNHCIVLSDRLDQLRYLQQNLGYGLMIDGSMVSKKGKQQRREAIEKMRSGEETVLFASYSLAKEGLDIPILDRLFMASPKKDKSVIIQAVGRIERVHPDKSNPIVYDYVDDCDSDFNMLLNMYRKRKTIYRKNGNKINE